MEKKAKQFDRDSVGKEPRTMDPYAIQKTSFEDHLQKVHGIKKDLEQQTKYFSILLENMKAVLEKQKNLVKALGKEDKYVLDLQKLVGYLRGSKKTLAVVVEVLQDITRVMQTFKLSWIYQI